MPQQQGPGVANERSFYFSRTKISNDPCYGEKFLFTLPGTPSLITPSTLSHDVVRLVSGQSRSPDIINHIVNCVNPETLSCLSFQLSATCFSSSSYFVPNIQYLIISSRTYHVNLRPDHKYLLVVTRCDKM